MYRSSRDNANGADLETDEFQAEVRVNIAGSAGHASSDDVSAFENDYLAGIRIPFGDSRGLVRSTGYFEDPALAAYHYGQVEPYQAGGQPRLFKEKSNCRFLHTIADKFWQHRTTAAGILDPAVGTDVRYDNIQQALTMQTRLYGINSEGLLFNQNKPVVRSKCNVEIEEPLLGFSGMSMFTPSRIMSTMDYLPPLIQEYMLYMNQIDCVKCESDKYDVVELVPSSEYSIQTRSVSAFDQDTKSLQTAEIPCPFLQRFESSSETCEFELIRGPPDDVFLFLERKQTVGKAWSKYQPVIQTLELKLIGQTVDSISMLDEKHLYYATKRNSDFRCDTNYNRQFRGGLLLTRSDFENWAQWTNTNGLDTFKGSFTIPTYNDVDFTYVPEEVLKDRLSTADRTFTVVFVYRNHSFKGSLNNCRFWRTDI